MARVWIEARDGTPRRPVPRSGFCTARAGIHSLVAEQAVGRDVEAAGDACRLVNADGVHAILSAADRLEVDADALGQLLLG